jgi:hypothetical protein
VVEIDVCKVCPKRVAECSQLGRRPCLKYPMIVVYSGDCILKSLNCLTTLDQDFLRLGFISLDAESNMVTQGCLKSSRCGCLKTLSNVRPNSIVGFIEVIDRLLNLYITSESISNGIRRSYLEIAASYIVFGSCQRRLLRVGSTSSLALNFV